MEAIAKLRGIKGSPQKARLVIDLIRGRNVSQALAILKFTDKRAAQPITKCLNSAIANATYLAEQQNIAIDPDDLWVKTCFVDMGPHKNRRRMRPAPQGRAYREQRHYCHITIHVSSEGQPKKEEKAPKKVAKPEGKAAEGEEKNVKTGVKAEQKKKAKALKETKTEEVDTTAETTAAETTEAVEVQEQATENVQTEEVKAEDKSTGETENAAAEETASEGTAEASAEGEEEKTGTDEAEERQLDENEQLERQ